MYKYLESACDSLVGGIGFCVISSAQEHSTGISATVANTFFRSLMPFRDYDNRQLDNASRRNISLTSGTYMFAKTLPTTTSTMIKIEPKEEPRDDDDNQLTDDNAARQKVRRIDLTDIPDVQVTKTETAKMGTDKQSTTISDANTVATRESMQRGLPDATAEMRARLGTLYGLDTRDGVRTSEVARLARTIVIMLLEPISLRVVSNVRRPDAALAARERARLTSDEPPTLDDVRAMNRHITAMTINLFAGTPEFALDATRLVSESAYRALFFLVVFGNVLFATNSETATSHVLDDFRHNAELERRVERGALIGRTCVALVRGVDRHYRAGLRNRLLMALDAAMTNVSALRQPFNNNPANLERLARAKCMLAEIEME
jgi:hypothetical protein